MLSNQIELKFSNYLDLYDLVIPKDHILRKIKEMVDFSFIYDELENKYCLNNGRNAKNPILLFQYLLLKFFYNLSDVGVVERSRYDLSFKYFLDLLISKSVELAIEVGVLNSKIVIIDSTHTKARYNKQSIRELLIRETSKLYDAINKSGTHEDLRLPKIPTRKSTTDETVAYSKE